MELICFVGDKIHSVQDFQPVMAANAIWYN
jgi:hypothetical protein